MAENMMELIDGYCRLENDTDDSVIFRANRGTSHSGRATFPCCFLNTTVDKTHSRVFVFKDRGAVDDLMAWLKMSYSNKLNCNPHYQYLLDVNVRSSLPEIPTVWVDCDSFTTFFNYGVAAGVQAVLIPSGCNRKWKVSYWWERLFYWIILSELWGTITW